LQKQCGGDFKGDFTGVKTSALVGNDFSKGSYELLKLLPLQGALLIGITTQGAALG
jgi:hypothetical protein